MIMQYDYDRAKDLDILAAVLKVWKPPAWAAAWYTRPGSTERGGNCIAASRFAHHVLDLLHVECEVTVTRVDAPGMLVGWGDCRTYVVPDNDLPGHAVVVGHDWLLDVAGEVLGAPGPMIALPVARSEWVADGGTYHYTWAPGLSYQAWRGVEYGAKAPARRIAHDVRSIVGPCRAPRPFEWM